MPALTYSRTPLAHEEWWANGKPIVDTEAKSRIDQLVELDAAEFLEAELEFGEHEFRLCNFPVHLLPPHPPDIVEEFRSNPDDVNRILNITKGINDLGLAAFFNRRPLVIADDGERPVELADGWHRSWVVKSRGEMKTIPAVVARLTA